MKGRKIEAGSSLVWERVHPRIIAYLDYSTVKPLNNKYGPMDINNKTLAEYCSELNSSSLALMNLTWNLSELSFQDTPHMTEI